MRDPMNDDRYAIKTPATHPQHEVVGLLFCGWDRQVYYCDSYDPRQGFWMTNVLDAKERRNVSEQAIGRTFHSSRLQQWKPTDLTRELSGYWLVDARDPAAAFIPRLADYAEARAAPWQVGLFATERDALIFAHALQRAHGARAGAAV